MLIVIDSIKGQQYALNVFHISSITTTSEGIVFALLNGNKIDLSVSPEQLTAVFTAYLEKIKQLQCEARWGAIYAAKA